MQEIDAVSNGEGKISTPKKKVEMIEHDEEKEGTRKVEIRSDQSITDNSKMDEILRRLDDKDREIDILKNTVSKSKYDFEREKIERDTTPRVRFKLYNGVPIIGYKSLSQKIILSPVTGMPSAEDIRYEWLLADGSKKEIDLREVTGLNDIAIAHVISKRIERNFELYSGKKHDHEEIFTCEFLDSELNAKYGNLDVPVTYINL